MTKRNSSSNSNYVRSDQYIEDRDAIHSALKELGVSLNRLASVANVSAAALSTSISGKYTSCPRPIFEAALEAIDSLRATRGYRGSMPFVETSVVKLMKQTCDEAYALRETDSIGLATGVPGVGKTTALKRYVEKTKFAVYLRASTGMSKSEMLVRLSELLGIQASSGTIASKQAKVARFLRSNPRLLILDEASRSTRHVLEALRDLTDDAEAGLVFAGREQLYDLFASNLGHYGEIASRILTWNPPIRGLDEDDIYLIINKAAMTASISDESKDMIYQCSEGNARVLQHLMQKLHNWRANTKARGAKSELTPSIISKIYQKAVVPISASWQKN